MQSRVQHDRVKVTLGSSENDMFAMVGHRTPKVASPLRNLRHVRQNPDLGRAQLASLLRASRRATENDLPTLKGWEGLMANLQGHGANDQG